MLCPIGQSNEKPPLQALAKWWEHVTSQYPTLTVNYTGAFHDRLLIIDEETAYHIGASIKDAGKNVLE